MISIFHIRCLVCMHSTHLMDKRVISNFEQSRVRTISLLPRHTKTTRPMMGLYGAIFVLFGSSIWPLSAVIIYLTTIWPVHNKTISCHGVPTLLRLTVSHLRMTPVRNKNKKKINISKKDEITKSSGMTKCKSLYAFMNESLTFLFCWWLDWERCRSVWAPLVDTPRTSVSMGKHEVVCTQRAYRCNKRQNTELFTVVETNSMTSSKLCFV